LRRLLTLTITIAVLLTATGGRGAGNGRTASEGSAVSLRPRFTLLAHSHTDVQPPANGVALLLVRSTVRTLARSAPESARALRMSQPCDSRALRRMTPRTYHRRLVVRLIRCVVRRFPVQGGVATALCIARRESGPQMWPWAKNPSGSWGIFQIIPATFASWWHAYPLVRHWILRARPGYRGDRRMDAYSSVVLGVRAMSDGLSPWGGRC
jgi:hypothetical protein